MPPVRRQGAGSRPRQTVANYVNQPSVEQLRQQCLDRGLSDHGRRNTLIARLQQHATINDNATEASTRPAASNNAGNAQPSNSRDNRGKIRHETVSRSEAPLLTSAQLAQIQSIVSQTVQQSMNDIATNAARAAVQAMANTPVSIGPNESRQNHEPPRVDEATSNIILSTAEFEAPQAPPQPRINSRLPYGQSFHDVPATYIRQIQSGEFFELSKLLPKNLFAPQTSSLFH